MKILTIVLRVLLGLLCLMPILGAAGVFPAPTADLYTPSGWAFMSAMMGTGYYMPVLGITFAIALVFIIMNRMAIAALILAPLTVNIVLFHLFIDRGLFAPDAIPADLFLLLNGFFLWKNWPKYKALW